MPTIGQESYFQDLHGEAFDCIIYCRRCWLQEVSLMILAISVYLTSLSQSPSTYYL